MQSKWVVLHGGALGDLALTLRVAIQFLRGEGTGIHVVSRVRPGDLSGFRPTVTWTSTETAGLHHLYQEQLDNPPEALANTVCGRSVLNALGPKGGIIERRIEELGAKEVRSFDPRPRDATSEHILLQWAEDSGLDTHMASDDGERNPSWLERGLDVAKQRPSSRESRYELLDFVDLAARFPGLAPHPAGEDRRSSRSAAREPGSRPIAIHPGSGGIAKCWPAQGYIELARRLRDVGHYVTVLLGPVELERFHERDIDGLRDAGTRIIQSSDADELLRAIKATELLIGNDAGPSHLAALIGKPTLTIFGPTRAKRWGPVSNASIALQCDPVRPNWGITADDVLAAANLALALGDISPSDY